MIDMLLFFVGCLAGVLANWAIYRLAILNPRPVSPWSRLYDPQRRWTDFVPVLGWWFQRRLADKFGRRFWVRPLLIELACGFGLPSLRSGIDSGILTACDRFALSPSSTQSWVWLAFFYLLLILLVAATFIDFDEKTIPDEITLTGTLIALLVAYFVPASRLPTVDLANAVPQIESLNFASPNGLPDWHRGLWGLVACIVVAVVWMFAIAPKRFSWRYGMLRGCKLLWASMIRPPRKSQATSIAEPRKMFGMTKFVTGLLVVLVAFFSLAWSAGGTALDNLFGAMMGLAFGGGLVWAVRIVAGGALGKEAMGFGDVTLMGMIGAWLGWQPALLVFAIAPFAALFIAVAQLLIMRHTEIAFGPYLSLGALFVLVFWGSIWHDWAKDGIFALGPILLAITLVCLVLMGAMLGGWRLIKDRWFGADE